MHDEGIENERNKLFNLCAKKKRKLRSSSGELFIVICHVSGSRCEFTLIYLLVRYRKRYKGEKFLLLFPIICYLVIGLGVLSVM